MKPIPDILNPDPGGDMFLYWAHDCEGHGNVEFLVGAACMWCGAWMGVDQPLSRDGDTGGHRQ
jgi:hypothetical protein